MWITHHPQARLRVVGHRGVSSAAMLYDHLPIVDIFRRLDAHTEVVWFFWTAPIVNL
jgi:hypothetical protein